MGELYFQLVVSAATWTETASVAYILCLKVLSQISHAPNLQKDFRYNYWEDSEENGPFSYL
jgi:hypothetical protein